ncbi:amino acid ABC transporter permease [Clostridium butyricum]|uniref:amino acid ABC transporter permease n=3 Tax=Clostridiaceae TaxID=31979 RepID=UPI002ABE8C30|nr:amino acid ABC transporter permease [Clostridium butyricum]
MKDDGTLEDISNKWLNTNVIAKNNDSFLAKLLKSVFNGAKVTILLSIISMIIGLMLGTIISVIRNLKVPVLSQIFSLYVSFFRGTPVLVQLFLLYFGLPEIFPILKGMGGFTAAYIALGFNASAYISEVLRGSFNAIDKGQMEACLAIGMNHIQAIKRIVLPQVLRISIPSIGNIYIDIIKGSSLAFTIGVAEILAKAQMIASANYKFFESYILIAVIYWIIIEILTYLQKVLEKRLSIY